MVDELSFGELAGRAQKHAEGLAADHTPVFDDGDPVELLVDLIAADIAGVPAIVADHRWSDQVRRAAVASAEEMLGAYKSTVRLVLFDTADPDNPRPVGRSTTSWTHSFPTFSALTGIDAGQVVTVLGPWSQSPFLFGVLHAITMGAVVRLDGDPASCTAVHGTAASLADLPDGLRPSIAVSVDRDVDAAVEESARANGIELVGCYAPAELSVTGIRRPGKPVGRFRPFPGVAVSVDDGVIRAQSPYLAANADRYADGYATAGDEGHWDDTDDTFEVYART